MNSGLVEWPGAFIHCVLSPITCHSTYMLLCAPSSYTYHFTCLGVVLNAVCHIVHCLANSHLCVIECLSDHLSLHVFQIVCLYH